MTELDFRQIGLKRFCWVCFGTEQDDQDSSVVWICPCQCKGTMKWVHEDCLQRWIDEKQKGTNSPRVTCSQCRTCYVLSFPPINSLVSLMEQCDQLLYKASPYVAASILLGSVYWCCGSYGCISIIQVMGYTEGRRMMERLDTLILVFGLPVIPIALILAKLIKWEDFILRLWRRNAIKIPRPISYLIEPPPEKSRPSCEQILYDPGVNEPLGCTRMICSALILPTVSALFGEIFFSRFSSSQWRRSLIGGLAYLLLKGAMKIHLRKSQYARYSRRFIKNYVPSPNRADNTDSDSSGDDTTASGNDIDHMGEGSQQDESGDRIRGLTVSLTLQV